MSRNISVSESFLKFCYSQCHEELTRLKRKRKKWVAFKKVAYNKIYDKCNFESFLFPGETKFGIKIFASNFCFSFILNANKFYRLKVAIISHFYCLKLFLSSLSI